MEAISYESYIKLTSETDLGDEDEEADDENEEPTPSRRFA